MTPASLLSMPDLLAAGPVLQLNPVICSLVELGIEREMIEVVPVGIFRSYRGAILGQSPKPGTPLHEGDQVTLYMPERGIADRLPDGFLIDVPEGGHPERVFDPLAGGFLQPLDEPPPDGGPGREYDPYELARRQLDGGRQLLGVLDRALRRARRDIALRDQSLHATVGDPSFARTLLGLVGLDALDVSDRAAVFAAQSLAGFQDAVGTPNEAAALLEKLFDVPVRAEEILADAIPIPAPLRISLGSANSHLGRDTVPGARVADSRPAVMFTAGPMSSEEAGRRYRDVELGRKMEGAAAALVPACRPIRICYEVHPPDRHTRLGDPAHSLLGRISFLSKRSGSSVGALSPVPGVDESRAVN